MMRLACLALVVLCQALALTSEWVQQGRQLYAESHFSEARALFERALRMRPSNHEARLWLGYTELALDQLESALRRLEPLRSRMGRDEEYLFALSEANTRQARRLSERLAALGETSARAHQHLAYRYKAEGESQKAIEEWHRALALRPDLPGVHLEIAETLWEQQRYDEAAGELWAELHLQPSSFLASLRYGQYLLRCRQYQKAVPYLRIAARHRRYAEAFQLLAHAWQQLNRPDQARAVLNGGLAAFPGNAGLSEMQRKMGTGGAAWNPPRIVESEPAPESLRARLARHPNDEDALYSLSRLYSSRGQLLFEELERLAPRSHRVVQGKGLNAEYAGDLATAERHYREVLARAPKLLGARYTLGHVLRMQGKEDEAIEHLNAELAVDPRHHLAQYELGEALLRHGDVAGAVTALERAVALQPRFAESRTELAKAYLQQSRPKEAARLLKEVVASSPEHPTAHFLLYRAYTATGAAELAKQQLAIHQELNRRRSVRVPIGAMGPL